MGKVVLHVSMSVDGYSAGPNDDLRVLHGWAFGDQSQAMHPDVSAEFMRAGAVVFGARTLRAGDDAWGDEDIFPMPVFVVSSERRDQVSRNGSVFAFVDGVDAAITAARTAAGDGDVMIMGSANVFQQALAAGLVDELEIALTSVLLGGGIRLFEHSIAARLELVRELPSKGITHLRYRVER